ncbi:hypothetical protein HWV62_36869 [Athelia sp. TMB]|nr:hypothetical protein HWV62_36869 [Athelia sp. TMB]
MWPLLPALLSAALVAAQGDPTAYAPTANVQCPSEPLLRVFTPQNQTLHPQEAAFVAAKDATVLPAAWAAWIGNGSQIGYAGAAFGGNYSRVGIAISGGGYRAAQYGAGVLSALDARNASALAAGTGGLLQVATYWSGLSGASRGFALRVYARVLTLAGGGSWLTGSLALNDWPTVPDLVYGNGGDLSGWLLDLDLVIPDGIDVFDGDNQAFYGSLLMSIKAKAAQGFETSITDPWARAIAYHFLNGTSTGNFYTNDSAHGAGQRWSDVQRVPSFQSHVAPFPIIVATSLPIGSNLSTPPLAQTVYEMTPLEFGSWDPALSAMVNMSFAGTHLVLGLPANSSACVNGFDDAGFIMGTSASLFPDIIDEASDTIAGISADESKGLLFLLNQLLQNVTTRRDDVANWPNVSPPPHPPIVPSNMPQPFQAINTATFGEHNATSLELVDGGLGLENIPLGPLYVNSRGLDVVFAVDGSADTTDAWPNGTSMVTTQARLAQVLSASHQAFPAIPASEADFVATGTNSRPTFFGCDPGENPPSGPLLVYLPNSPPLTGAAPSSNFNTFKLSYTALETRTFLDQAHANTIGGFTPNSNSPDADFGKCVQCAAVDRARFRQNTTARSSVCQACFVRYCYDPAHPPSVSALPNRQLTLADPKAPSWLDRHKAALIGGIVGAADVLAEKEGAEAVYGG